MQQLQSQERAAADLAQPNFMPSLRAMIVYLILRGAQGHPLWDHGGYGESGADRSARGGHL